MKELFINHPFYFYPATIVLLLILTWGKFSFPKSFFEEVDGYRLGLTPFLVAALVIFFFWPIALILVAFRHYIKKRHSCPVPR